MLTDEELDAIKDAHWEYDDNGARVPIIDDIVRAAIAAHEAKRAMPEEWIAETYRLKSEFARAVEQCYANATKETRLAYIKAEHALIAHISTPLAGMVLVPEEPTEAILRPFIACPTDELPLAWQAAMQIAKIAAAKEPK